MTASSIFTRDDTFFGVCEAIGEDFGFNANWLRIAFAVPLLWNPVLVLSLYVGAGLLVFATRWLVPNPAASYQPAEPSEPTAPAEDENEDIAPLAAAA